MSIITQGAFLRINAPVFAFTHMKYKEHVPSWPEMFYRTTSTMMYEEFVSGNTFGYVPVNEADNIAYASESQTFTHQVTPVIYAMGYQGDIRGRQNDLYETLGKDVVQRRWHSNAPKKSFTRTCSTEPLIFIHLR